MQLYLWTRLFGRRLRIWERNKGGEIIEQLITLQEWLCCMDLVGYLKFTVLSESKEADVTMIWAYAAYTQKHLFLFGGLFEWHKAIKQWVFCFFLALINPATWTSIGINSTLGYIRTETKLCFRNWKGRSHISFGSGFHYLGIREAYVWKPRRAVPGLGRRVPCNTQKSRLNS